VRSKEKRGTASLPRLEPRQRRGRGGGTVNEHLPLGGRFRATRRHNVHIRRRRWLVDGKDEGGKNTATLIRHPHAEIIPKPENPGLDSVLAQDVSGSATIRRWKRRLTKRPHQSAVEGGKGRRGCWALGRPPTRHRPTARVRSGSVSWAAGPTGKEVSYVSFFSLFVYFPKPFQIKFSKPKQNKINAHHKIN
jgi:hypothetical protein